METNIDKIIERAEEIAGNWNGEDIQGEEKAQIALEIIEVAKKLKELIEELNN